MAWRSEVLQVIDESMHQMGYNGPRNGPPTGCARRCRMRDIRSGIQRIIVRPVTHFVGQTRYIFREISGRSSLISAVSNPATPRSES